MTGTGQEHAPFAPDTPPRTCDLTTHLANGQGFDGTQGNKSLKLFHYEAGSSPLFPLIKV